MISTADGRLVARLAGGGQGTEIVLILITDTMIIRNKPLFH